MANCGSVKTSVKIKVPTVPKCKVIMYNDDVTTMEFVIEVLMSIYEMTSETAYSTMMKIHLKGEAVVGAYSKEIAETKVKMTTELARAKSFPLKCEIME